MAIPKSHECRHCGEPFVPFPGKPGFNDECPECLCAAAEQAKPRSNNQQLQKLFEYMVANPLTVRLDDGAEVTLIGRTVAELGAKLRRTRLSPASIDKLITGYEKTLLSVNAGSTHP